VGAEFPEGAQADTEPSYMQGVFATDEEDDNAALSASITHSNNVDTTSVSAWTVTYSVTDSDDNTAEAAGVVLVGDWQVIDGYAIDAHDFARTISQVSGTEAEAIELAEAQAYCVDPAKPSFGQPVPVFVKNFGGYDSLHAGQFTITFAVTENANTTLSVLADIDNGDGPQISFTTTPLTEQQTPGVSQILDDQRLKYGVVVSDVEDDAAGLAIALEATPLDELGNATSINTASIGITKVRYVACDSHGNQAVAYRAVVVSDGRYIISDEDDDDVNDVIIGARNFVVKQADVKADENAIRGLSYAEAYTVAGDRLAVHLTTIPAGYTTGTAAPGSYDFTWQAEGFSTNCTITGQVVLASAVDPGTKDSQYAIYASDFMVNTTDAQRIVDEDSFVNAADVHVVKLVDGVADRSVVIDDRSGFKAEQGTYQPIRFTIEGISATSQKVEVKGTVSDGCPPELQVSTPLEVWVGAEQDRPATAITAEQYQPLYGVSVSDVEDGSAMSLEQVQYAANGPEVDTAIVGIYRMDYSVTDSDHNQVNASRTVVVNDGRYSLGAGRILTAKPFVIKASSVTTEADLLRAQLLGKTGARLYDATTGAAVADDQISFPSTGGYTNQAGSYQITVSGVDSPASNPAITRVVTAEVVDAEIIEATPPAENTDSWYVFGNNITLTPVQARAILAAADPDAALLSALGAGARRTHADGAISELAALIVDNGGFSDAVGNYQIVLTDADEQVTAQLTATVATGFAPNLSANPKPLVIKVSDQPGELSEAQLMQGVNATDIEDDHDGIALIPTIVGGLPSIAADAASVTSVTYTVTDSAGNTATTSRAVIVDDGSYVWDNNFILRANSFVIGASEVSSDDKPGQIRQLANAEAWTVEGQPLPASDIVVNPGGYCATPGDYPVALSLSDDPSLQREITAKVFNDSSSFGTNGDAYAILASDFRINVLDANALAAQSAQTIEGSLLSRAGVRSYKRSSDMGVERGSKQLADDGGFSLPANRPLKEGDTFTVTFTVAEDDSATVSVTLLVSNASAPLLNVPAIKVVDQGASFTEEDFWAGVTYSDREDTPEQLAASREHSPQTIDTTKPGPVQVTYAVTDSDHNRTEATGVVLVNDGSYVVGADYILQAFNFHKDFSEVQGGHEEIITASAAKAWRIADLSPATVLVVDDGHYAKALGVFSIQLAVASELTTTKTIQALVDGAGNLPWFEFETNPLVLEQSPASHILSNAELMAGVKAYDIEDGDITHKASPAIAGGLSQIDTRNIGVYKVNYSVTDAQGNSVTAARAVVITDGRYVIDEADDIILGARNFVVAQKLVDGTESQVRSLSYAEAFRFDGTPLSDELHLSAIPAGYVKAAPVGDYLFTWAVSGHKVTKAVTGKVTDASVVDPGGKDSQYALIASDFAVNTTEAAAMTTNASFIQAAHAEVVKLVPNAADKAVRLIERGGFSAAQGTYQIDFGAEGLQTSELHVAITATVSDGQAPQLLATSPVEVALGADFDPLSGVTCLDSEDGDLSGCVEVAGEVDTNSVGLYHLNYSVEDSDYNKATAERIVVVNDGRYVLGDGRVLTAQSFVTQAGDVTTNPALLNAEILGKSHAALYDGRTGAVVDAVSVGNRGGYCNQPDTYTISLHGVDVPPGVIVRNIEARVVDADVLVNGTDEGTDPEGGNGGNGNGGNGNGSETQDSTYVWANNVRLTPFEVTALLEAADPDQALIDLCQAGAARAVADGTLADKAVVVSSNGGLQAEQGNYTVTFTEPVSGVSAAAVIEVVLGEPPVLNVPRPMVVPVADEPGQLDRDDLMDGVSATDPDGKINPDGSRSELDITDDVTVDTGAGIPADEPGIYQVVYAVDDIDGNHAEVSVAVVVDDGSFVYDADYILSAHSFLIGLSQVDTRATSAQILAYSDAIAARSDGSPAATTVRETAGYTAAKGDYRPIISIVGHPALTKTITARVFDDASGNGSNGQAYSLLAYGFRINLTDAAALQEQYSPLASDYDTALISRANARSYLRADASLAPAGTVTLVDDDGFARTRRLEEGDRFYLTFAVAEEPDTTVIVRMLVSNASAPVLNVPALREVKVDTIYHEADYWDGVSYSDNEDDVSQLVATHDPDAVNAGVAGLYEVGYYVTDTDHNTTTASGQVLVNDGNFVVGERYIVYAHDFSVDYAEALGTAEEALTLSGAYAIDRQTMERVPVEVVSLDGYRKWPGVYPVQIAPVDDNSCVRVIRANVTGEPARFLVTFNANGGQLNGPLGLYVIEPADSLAYMPQAPTRDGYRYRGWNTMADGTGDAFTANTRVYQNITVYAQWEAEATPVQQPPTIIVNPPTVNVTVLGDDHIVEVPTPVTTIEPAVTPTGDYVAGMDYYDVWEDTPHWSIINVLLTALLLLLLALYTIKYFLDRKRWQMDEEDDWQAILAGQPLEPRQRDWQINVPVLLIGLLALVEAAVILIASQDFNATMWLIDRFTIWFALLSFVVLGAPLVASALAARRQVSLEMVPTIYAPNHNRMELRLGEND
jgi:uncharacterized repeat protein (TIGR02543 family)